MYHSLTLRLVLALSAAEVHYIYIYIIISNKVLLYYCVLPSLCGVLQVVLLCSSFCAIYKWFPETVWHGIVVYIYYIVYNSKSILIVISYLFAWLLACLTTSMFSAVVIYQYIIYIYVYICRLNVCKAITQPITQPINQAIAARIRTRALLLVRAPLDHSVSLVVGVHAPHKHCIETHMIIWHKKCACWSPLSTI